MSIADFSIRRPVAVSICTIGIMLLGFVSLQKIPMNLLPEITYPKITIRTEYPHAAPREVEERVTKFMESAVGIINNVVKVSSVSRPGWSDVYIEFQWGSDIDLISMDIREKIQLLENILPEEVGRPLLLRYDPNQDPIVVLAVSGEGDLSELRRWVEMNMELELERLDGVAAVKVEGGYEDEIMVDVDEAKLNRFGLSIATVADRLQRENVNLAGGSLEEGGTRLAVRTVNRFANLDDIRNVIVAGEGQRAAAGGGQNLPVAAISGLGGGMGGMGGMMGGGGLPAGLGSLLSMLGGTGAAAAATTSTASSHVGPTAVIRIQDIAAVTRRHKDRSEIARINGRECVKVSVFKEGDANIVTVARAVHAAVASLREMHRAEPRSPQWEAELKSPSRQLKKLGNLLSYLLLNVRPFTVPEEPIALERAIAIETISDQSRFILEAILSVAQNAVIGSLFAVMVLYLFLRNWFATLIVGIAIPISFITTFNLMFFQGISFNIMSLGGLALGVGVLVDNSIIVIENILRHRTFQTDIHLSAKKAAEEMAMPVITGSLTNVIVFFPILYLEGMFRQLFSDLAWTVTYSTLCSAIVAITIVPMLAVLFGRRVSLPKDLYGDMNIPPELIEAQEEAERKRLQDEETKAHDASLAPVGCLLRTLVLPIRIVSGIGGVAAKVFAAVFKYPLQAFDAGFGGIRRGYPGLLRRLLRHPFLVSVISVGIGFFSVTVLYLLGWELTPAVDQGEFRIRVELPAGTPIERTNQRIAGLEAKLQKITGGRHWVDSIFATVGIGAAEGEGTSEKAENIGEIHLSLDERRPVRDEVIISEAMAGLRDEVELSARSAKPQLLSFKRPIEIEIEGNNLDNLKLASESVIAGIRKVPGLVEIESSMGLVNPEVNIAIDRDRAAALGLSVSAITDVIQRKIKGEVASRFDQPDQQLDIVVQLEKSDRDTVEQLERITISGPAGEIQLNQVADIRPALGPATITRVGNSRVALVRANLHGRALGEVVADLKTALGGIALPGDCTARITGQNEEMQRSLPSLYLAMALAIILVYILLASEFESLAHPFIIMFCVPFAMIGLVVILLLTGQTINMSSMIGILMMIGILDNVAIVLVSAINQNRDEGLERFEAIVTACHTRFRPILITNVTTILGMVPMAIAWGPGTELSAPMAIAVIGGLTSATMLTLLATPCLYLALDMILPRTYHPHPVEPETGPASPGVSPA